MNILFLNHTLRGHGTYFRAFDIARELVRLGHSATLLTASREHWYRVTEAEQAGVRIVETPSWNPLIHRDDGWGPLDIPYRLARVLRERCDIVYAFAHPPNIYLPARMAQLLRRKPLVVDWCDRYGGGIFDVREEIRAYAGEQGLRRVAQRWAERVETRLERRIVRKADAVTVISEDLRDRAIDLGVSADHILHLSGGANIDVFRPLDKTECREQLRRACGTDGLEGEGPFIAYTANYNPDERFFMAAMARVFERFPSARLLSTAPAFTEESLPAEGVRERIIYLGRQPYERLPAVLGAADVLALPLADNASNRARWPNKIGDYLAAGRPVAACAVGDVANLFSAASPIGAASAPTPEAFGDAIIRLLSQPEEWPSLGAAARRLAEERLDWQVLGRTVEAFLKNQLARA